MATVDKAFRVKNGLVVEGATATVNTHDVITKEIFDVKGDLIVGTGSNTGTRLAAGTNGYVLTADSAETNGLKWAAAPAVGAFDTSIVFEGTTANDFETTLTVTDPTADRTITFKDESGTVAFTADIPSVAGMVTETGTQTLTNKTLTSPVVDGNGIIFEGATANEFETTLTVTDPTGDRTITLPNVSGTVITTGDSGTVTSAMIENGTIVNADINASAEIAQSKISGLTTDLGNKASSSDLTTHTGATEAHGATGAVVGTTNTQTLTNKTLTSPVVSGLTLSDASIVIEGATGNDFETTLTVTDPTGDRTVTFPDATGTVALTNNKLDAFAATTSAELRTVISDETGTGGLVFADTPTLVTPNIGAATGTSLVLSGDLTVNGTTTTINSTEITIDDKNLVLGSVATPTDAGADGGGLTLKGATDKTLNWVDATDSWTSSEHLDLASGKVLKVNGTQVLSATEYTGNAATVTNGVYTTSKISALAATSSSELAGVISDETGTGALVFANTPTLVTPEIGAATGTSLSLTGSVTLADALIGTALATASTSATTIDSWSATTYSSAKYLVQMKKNTDIEVLEVLVTIDGNNTVYITEYADVISNQPLGETHAVYSSGNVLLQVTGVSADTSVKVHKVYIEA